MADKSILIVEDERILAEDLKEILLEMKYCVSGIACCSEEALEHVAKHPVDLVLMDIKLKGETDGIQTSESLKLQYGIPIVYITAYCDDTILAKAKATEPLGYIIKPYRASEIKATIEIALHKAGTEKKLRGTYCQLERLVKQRTVQLAETNAALKELLEFHEKEKMDIIQAHAENLKTLVIPHLDTITMKSSAKEVGDLMRVVKHNLESISRSSGHNPFSRLNLTSMETRVAELIRQGRSSKEIAQLLGITVRGVTFHRDSIRRKIGIHKSKTSLKAALSRIKE